MANETVYTASGSTNFAYQYDGGNGSGDFWCGYDPTLHNEDGALRFTSVALNQNASVSLATLRIYIESRDGSSTVNEKVYGIKEGNTADFSSSPFGRTRTGAFVTTGNSEGVGNYWTINIATVVNEILGQGGWSSGNAMGFVVVNDGTTGDNAVFDTSAGTNSEFVARENAEPDFTPTPGSISAPTFPAATNFGMKFAKPGINVLTAAEADLYFTTRKKSLKIVAEGEVACTAVVEKLIAHGLNYSPAALAYVSGGGKRFKLPRYFDGAVDPIGGGVEGFVGTTDTNLKIYLDTNSNVYYYVFIDPLNL